MRITEEANDALKKVAARFPQWSLVTLGNTLMLESCNAILAEGAPTFPTIDYIRQQLGHESSTHIMESMVERIERAAASFNEAKASHDAKTKQAARGKRAA